MGRYWRYLIDLGIYLSKQRYPAGLLLIIVLSLVVLVGWPQELWLRRWGAALQLIGVLTVALGIRKTRRDFGQRGLFGDAWRSLLKFPKLAPKHVSVAIGGQELNALTGLAAGKASATGNLSSTVQEQIDQLRQSVAALTKAADDDRAEAERQFGEVNDKITGEQAVREQGDVAARKLITEAQTGGLNLSVFGTVCILLGTIFGNLTPEMVAAGQWIARQFAW